MPGTRGHKMIAEKANDRISEDSSNSVVLATAMYAPTSLLAWLTIEPPKRLAWKLALIDSRCAKISPCILCTTR